MSREHEARSDQKIYRFGDFKHFLFEHFSCPQTVIFPSYLPEEVARRLHLCPSKATVCEEEEEEGLPGLQG